MEPDVNDIYRSLIAVNGTEFNTCYYCGCIATEVDLVPPLRYASFYLLTRSEADFLAVPSCKECCDILKKSKLALLSERFTLLKRTLERRYRKALRVYQMWEDDEADDLDYHLQHSIDAGIRLGEEAYRRVRYQGFKYEVDGVKYDFSALKTESFDVFGETFQHFRDALAHASHAFQIPKAKLVDLVAETDGDFNQAITSFHDELAAKEFEKELKALCVEFAKKHSQNTKFVMRAAKSYLDNDQDLSIPGALEMLEKDRFSK